MDRLTEDKLNARMRAKKSYLIRKKGYTQAEAIALIHGTSSLTSTKTAGVVLAEGNGRKPGVVLNFPANSSRKRDGISFTAMPIRSCLPPSVSTPSVSMNFSQPLSWVHTPSTPKTLYSASPWLEVWRKLFWLLFALSCLSFLVWGNFIRMEGPLAEVLFKASFGEILVFGAGLMSFRSMLDQAQKVIVSLAGIGISLFLTQATISEAHADASSKRQLARESLLSETVARDSIAKNLYQIAPDRIKRAEEIRVQLTEANERVQHAEARLSAMPKAHEQSHSADLIIRLLAQLSVVLSVSQIRRPTREAS